MHKLVIVYVVVLKPVTLNYMNVSNVLCTVYFLSSQPSKIHILGSFQNIRIARNAICSLILGELCV